MKHTLLTVLLCVPCISPAFGSLSLHTLFTPVDASFTGFTAPTVWATSNPAAGQLDSDLWTVNADGPLATTSASFGVDQAGGQGSSTGSESAAGVFAFEVSAGQTALGVQPTGTYWTPGMFTLRVQNDTATTLNSLRVEWTAWIYNDQGRSNDFRFLHSANNLAYLDGGSELAVLSPAESSGAQVAWQASPRSVVLDGLGLSAGSPYYLRWGGDDVGGSGSRDEFGITSVRITPIPEPSALGLLVLGSAALVRRRR